ncbi:hypothetical protein BSR29_07800 [Boudabousia liubingyangii]|uniref:Polyphosphate kinase-2-related domain-containing protein n=1 Tax=Boudabousia liubingyangii TaxID=1921764 RepID=A0A1Q5PJV9_9ACTO|nr:hypothetical protein BSR29_07800 [Boudabousia liubingyangii]OKL46520.1 hypothetical protein BSR28_07095 [Boudabousia liubingyangii]
MKLGGWQQDPRTALRVDEHFDLAAFDRSGTPGWTLGRKAAEAFMEQRAQHLSDLQEQLFANGKTGSRKRILVVAQGLDTAGKGGLARHVMGQVDPQGVALKAFKAPTPEERAEPFLARIERALPKPGMIGFFDRSQYEDMLVPGVNGMGAEELAERGRMINDFEKQLVDDECVILKVCLMVSYGEQGRRLLERLDRPDKHWKFSPHDLEVRGQWFKYQSVYQEVLRQTSTDYAPWMVIPADHKWYARAAVSEALTRSLEEMELTWPEADFNVAEERARLALTLDAEPTLS